MNIPWEVADHITLQSLKEVRACLKRDLKKGKPLVFETDPVEDKKVIREHIKAAELMIKYFSV